ncbi:MAG: hypothetical protein LIP02_04110 [Bacteroidales bacterium]|nr:hypothetical protein [Bacteroidales bacterium]
MKISEIQRVQRDLDYLRAKMAEFLMARNYARASELMLRITAKERELAEAVAKEERPLADVVERAALDREGVPDKIIKTILAADFLNDCFHDLKASLKRVGVAGSDCDKYAAEMESITRRYTNRFLDGKSAGLMKLVTEDDKLVADLHLLLDRYISDRLDILKTDRR